MALQRQGRLREAEKIYARVLKAAPDNFDALNLLGMRQGAARPVWARRIVCSARRSRSIRASPAAWTNLGQALHALKRTPEALDCLDKARALAPDDVDNSQSARQCAVEPRPPATRRSPNSSRCWRACRTMSRRGSIAASRRRRSVCRNRRSPSSIAALSIAPGHPVAHYNRGLALASSSAVTPTQSTPTSGCSRPRPSMPAPGSIAARALAAAQPARRGDRQLRQGAALRKDDADVAFQRGAGVAHARRLPPRL